MENSEFREFTMMLRPSFRMPSRKVLSGILLDSACSSIKAAMDSCIKAADYVSTVTDSWIDVNGRPIMNYIVLTPERSFLRAYIRRNSLILRYTLPISCLKSLKQSACRKLALS